MAPDGASSEAPYLELMRDVAAAVARAASFDDALDRLVDLVARRLGYDVCSVYLVDPDGDDALALRATRGLLPGSVGRVRMRPDEGLTGLVFARQRGLFLPRADEHPGYKYFPETGEERFRSFAGVPLLRRGRCLGVLTVQTVAESAFHPHEVLLLETLAEHVVGLIGVTESLPPPGGPAATEGGAAAPGERARRLLVGLGTSDGVGSGPALVLGADPLGPPPAPRRPAPADEELARYAAAQAAAIAELEALATRLEESGRAAAGAVFRAHQELARDGAIEGLVRGRVEGGDPIERAVHATFRECAAQLEGLGSAHVRERVADLLDVGALLLRGLGVGDGPAPAGGEGAGVVVADFLTPAQTAHLDPARVAAVVTEHGSATSHASILARSLGIPAVVGVAGLTGSVARGDPLLVDGDHGFVFVAPQPALEAEYAKRREAARAAEARIVRELEARAERGPLVAGVELQANVGFPLELQAAVREGAAGVGLLRTEFFFLQHADWPTSAEQVAFYRRAFAAAPPGPVVVRLLDAGGDKELPYMEAAAEPNPILGMRAVRLLLARWKIGRTQVEALLEAAAAEEADLRILVPLVTTEWELLAVRQMVEEAAGRLGVPPRPLGMMVEAPSVLFQLEDLLAHVDFASVGTNDLTQYLLAVDRDNERVRHYYSPFHPAVVRALAELARRAAAAGRPASICGEVASEPRGALAMLALGFRTLSVRPRALPALRLLVHSVPEAELDPLRERLLAARSPAEVERLLRGVLLEAAPSLA